MRRRPVKIKARIAAALQWTSRGAVERPYLVPAGGVGTVVALRCCARRAAARRGRNPGLRRTTNGEDDGRPNSLYKARRIRRGGRGRKRRAGRWNASAVRQEKRIAAHRYSKSGLFP